MAKEILGFIKLQIEAGKANPSPPVGPALGQRGLNIMDFCKAFNAKTQKEEPGSPIPVIITAYKDRTFSFVTKLPPVSYYIKKAANLKSASHASFHRVTVQVGHLLDSDFFDLSFGNLTRFVTTRRMTGTL